MRAHRWLPGPRWKSRAGVCVLILLSLTGLMLAMPAAAMRPPPVIAESASALPAEARATLKLIRQGGPFPYRQDGVVFGNRERQLPPRARGYYHEYTVITPGAHDRGARRIIMGGAGEAYYTDDHYRSFRRIEYR